MSDRLFTYGKSKAVCALCGSPLPESDDYRGRGRPARFCSVNCGEVYRFFSAVEKRLPHVPFTKSGLSKFKGDLFRCCNNLVLRKGK